MEASQSLVERKRYLTFFYLLCQPIVLFNIKRIIVPTECWPPPPPPYIFHVSPSWGGEGGGGTIGLRRGRDCLTYLGRRGQNTHSRLCPILLDLSIHLPFFWTQTKSVNELKGRTPGTLDKLIGQIRAGALNPRWSLSSPLCFQNL